MNKLEMLFIRACKSSNPEQRVRSVYRRFYYTNGDYDVTNYIVNILSSIADKVAPAKTIDILEQLSPQNNWKWPENASFDEKCLRIIINRMRYVAIDKLENYVSPAMFRNNP